ncbi:50S ribosomal protein L30 [bacterium]|nr:MAG: 50S ribosomal protein L30 [bacterium]
MSKIKVVQIKSCIKSKSKHKATITALGLGRPNNFNILPDNEQIRGMINVVNHLVKVEQVSE